MSGAAGGLGGGEISPEQTYFNGLLVGYIQTIHDTLKALDRTPTENLPKVGWDQVVNRCEQLSIEATRVGLLWTGGGPADVKCLADHMNEFFGLLQGLLLLAHGATVGGGPTLTAFITTSVKQFAEVNVKLMKLAIFSYDAREERDGDVLPMAIADVWRAWDALKTTPSNNINAIGRTVIQVAASIQDSLRKMKELKASFESPQIDKAKASTEAESSKKKASTEAESSKKKASTEAESSKKKASTEAESSKKKASTEAESSKKKASTEAESSKKKASGNAGGSTKKMKKASADLPVKVKSKASGEAARSSKHKNESDANDVSPEEIRIAGYITDVTSGALGMMKELIRAIMRLLNKEMEGALADSVSSLEKICELSQLIETQIKELGSCVAPPQEISAIKPALMKIANALCVLMMIVHQVGGSTMEFVEACVNLRNLMRQITTELTSSADEVLPGMGQLHL